MAKKKKRPLTAWQKHVQAYMADHPGVSFKEALPKAKRTYKKKDKANKAKNPNKKPRRKNTVPKKKKTRRRSFLNLGTVFKFIRLGGLLGPGIWVGTKTSGGLGTKLATALTAYSGIKSTTGKFDVALLGQMWVPFIVSNLVTRGVGKMNSMIRRL